MVSVLEGDKALGDLEEIAIRLIWCKVDVEDEGCVGSNLFLHRQHFERVLNHHTSSLVEHR